MREETEKAMLKKCTELNIQMIGVEHQLLLIKEKLDAMCAGQEEKEDLSQIQKILVDNVMNAFQKTMESCYELYRKVNNEAETREMKRLVLLRLDTFEEEIASVKKQLSLQ